MGVVLATDVIWPNSGEEKFVFGHPVGHPIVQDNLKKRRLSPKIHQVSWANGR